MRERETASDGAEESGRRRISIVAWMAAVVASFALGALVMHFALLQEPIARFSFQAFFASPFWSTASVGLVCFVLGLGFAYVPLAWYRDDANRVLKTEYQDLRGKADALRERVAPRERGDAPRAPPLSRAARPEEPQAEPPYAAEDEEPPDIAAVISEMSAAIKANLKEATPARPVDVDMRRALGSKPSDG